MKNLLRIPSLLLLAFFLSIPFSSQAIPSKALKKTEIQNASKKGQKTKSKKQTKRHWFKSLFFSKKAKPKNRTGEKMARLGKWLGISSNVLFFTFIQTLISSVGKFFFFGGLIAAISGIVVSIIALSRIKKGKSKNKPRKSKRRAIAGIIFSTITLLLYALLIVAFMSITI